MNTPELIKPFAFTATANPPESNQCWYGKENCREGLNYDHLALAFENNPTVGLCDLCREHCGILGRLTKSPKIIDKIVDYFVKLNEC